MPDTAEEIPGVSISIRLNPEARRVVENIRADSGVPSTEAMTRILEWFAGLDRKLRLAVLTRDVDTRRELSRLAFREMAAEEDPSGSTPDEFGDVARVARKMIDKMEQMERSRRQALQERLPPGKKRG